MSCRLVVLGGSAVSTVQFIDAPAAWPGHQARRPDGSGRLYGESYLADTLAVRLGGRAAERLDLAEASTGAADDLMSATALATQMVRDYGLSDKIGPGQLQRPFRRPSWARRSLRLF